jgi:hypothetical protein
LLFGGTVPLGIEEKPRESAQRSIVTVAYVILHLADFQWNQYDVPAFKRHGATNQYLQQDPSEERTSDPNRAYKRQAAAEYEKAVEKLLVGSTGGASPVRKIDPKTGDVVFTGSFDHRPSSQDRPPC